MLRIAIAAALSAFVAVAAPAQQTPAEVVAAAPAADWVAIPADTLLVMDLAPDPHGKPRRIIIQLIPAPFATKHVANIVALARAHWWDGTSINRVQDDYVVQWGDATERKPLPAGLVTVPASDYVAPAGDRGARARDGWHVRDAYAQWVDIERGWPIAGGGGAMWPVHCYGMVGVGRSLSPDTGSGAELYVVIGQATRQLDRNIAVVGRVISGIEHLSSLPRGTGALGFYETAAERTPIAAVRLASDLPAASRPRFEYLSSESAAFARYVAVRANRNDSFYFRPAGGVDVCNIAPPVRPAQS